MKRVTMKCNQCGYEERIEIFSREEAEKEGIGIAPPRCPKCGSPNVRLID
jgi:Zn finger protein HypA/HybF involved in hydrogenase expression